MKLRKVAAKGKFVFYTPEQFSDSCIPVARNKVSAGFPSPADDYIDVKLDLNKELVSNAESTFYARVVGTSMIGAGINDGDLLVIDKSLEPRNGNIAVCFIDGEFTVKRINIEKGRCFLVPENPQFDPIEIKQENQFQIWGIVTYVIHKF